MFQDRDSRDIIDLIEMCEGSGMGTSSRSPKAMLEEANAYFTLRNIVMCEKGRIAEIKHKRDKLKDK